MSLRKFIEKIDEAGKLVHVKKEVSRDFEAAKVLKTFEGKGVLFEKVSGSGFKVVGNVCSSKELISTYFGIPPTEITKYLLKAIENPSKPNIVNSAPCQEVIEEKVDLNEIPLLFHQPKDGGKYISAGVIVSRDKEYGQNLSFHRCMQISSNKLAIRILPRHLDAFIKRNGGELDVALCIGLPPNILLAAASSVEIGFDEITIANSLKPLDLVKAKSVDVLVPSETEFVLEGRITKEFHEEGPFVDLTETYDLVREQPVFEVKKITHRKNPFYQALLPGGIEHKLLMGMPREPTIFKEVSKACKCLDVYLTPGGCSWLHAVVQIKKESEEDGRKAIEAAFIGHSSLKQVTVVDEDINIMEPSEVEWAIATRFQADKKLVLKPREKGSSLDPSADPITRETCKVGIDATKPLVTKGKDFTKVSFEKINPFDYLT